MIVSFKDKQTETIASGRAARKLPGDIQRTALKKLRQLDAAAGLDDLQGNRAGQHSVRINDQWRICFRWDAGNAYDVEIVDYH